MATAAAHHVLLVVTSHDQLGASDKTGFWLEELAVPYYEFTKAGHRVDVASPKGGRPPIDPKSEKNPPAEVVEFLKDETAAGKLNNTLVLEKVNADDYQAVFVVGGHGACYDLASSFALGKLISAVWAKNHIVAAVCHGPSALQNGKKVNGDPLVKGLKVAGFSNEEEILVGLNLVVPFSLEDRLKSLGGIYERGPNWQPHAVVDGRLVTGQNPASSKKVAELTIQSMNKLCIKFDNPATVSAFGFAHPKLTDVMNIDKQNIDWQPFIPNISAHFLYRSLDGGPSAALLRFAPGASVPGHWHTGYENVVCVSGSFTDERGNYKQGDVMINPPGSQHLGLKSEEGCIVLIIWEKKVCFLEK